MLLNSTVILRRSCEILSTVKATTASYKWKMIWNHCRLSGQGNLQVMLMKLHLGQNRLLYSSWRIVLLIEVLRVWTKSGLFLALQSASTLPPSYVVRRTIPLKEFQATLKLHLISCSYGLIKALWVLSLAKNMKDKGIDKDKESIITDKNTQIYSLKMESKTK